MAIYLLAIISSVIDIQFEVVYWVSRMRILDDLLVFILIAALTAMIWKS